MDKRQCPSSFLLYLFITFHFTSNCAFLHRDVQEQRHNSFCICRGIRCKQALGTAILMMVILSVTDKQNTLTKGGTSVAVPALIGLTVSILISVIAPLTQAGFNPARDFGPRVSWPAYPLSLDRHAPPLTIPSSNT